MLKEFFLFIKYPYTAAIIATIWLGSAALLAMSDGLSMVHVVVINMFASVFIAFFGFSGKKEL
ncbi:MAG TPA: hypothetical protein VLE74_04140 [Candidatus Saccharimonadales bacterium]|nr:hypothetical protein [Candidatus Saccharimonadales bacterium]